MHNHSEIWYNEELLEEEDVMTINNVKVTKLVQAGGLVVWLARRACDQQVAGSTLAVRYRVILGWLTVCGRVNHLYM